jgi:hypothetical protein
MVYWQYCSCGRVVDEFESKCHWCKKPSDESEDSGQMRLFECVFDESEREFEPLDTDPIVETKSNFQDEKQMRLFND